MFQELSSLGNQEKREVIKHGKTIESKEPNDALSKGKALSSTELKCEKDFPFLVVVPSKIRNRVEEEEQEERAEVIGE